MDLGRKRTRVPLAVWVPSGGSRSGAPGHPAEAALDVPDSDGGLGAAHEGSSAGGTLSRTRLRSGGIARIVGRPRGFGMRRASVIVVVPVLVLQAVVAVVSSPVAAQTSLWLVSTGSAPPAVTAAPQARETLNVAAQVAGPPASRPDDSERPASECRSRTQLARATSVRRREGFAVRRPHFVGSGDALASARTCIPMESSRSARTAVSFEPRRGHVSAAD